MTVNSDESGTFFYVLQDALRILYVDDDPILREFAQVHLTTESASVTTAEDGLAGLAALEAAEPHIILTDHDMPRMDGFEMLRRLRADPRWERIPVIVATGREDVAAIDRAFREGATSFVVKPINWRLMSYQILYVHRAHQAEASLIEARRRARAEVAEVSESLTRLCTLGARFVADALRVDPSLKAPAAEYLQALERESVTARRAATG